MSKVFKLVKTNSALDFLIFSLYFNYYISCIFIFNKNILMSRIWNAQNCVDKLYDHSYPTDFTLCQAFVLRVWMKCAHIKSPTISDVNIFCSMFSLSRLVRTNCWCIEFFLRLVLKVGLHRTERMWRRNSRIFNGVISFHQVSIHQVPWNFVS